MSRDQAEVRRAVVDVCVALLLKSSLDRQRNPDEFILRRVLNELVWKYTEAQQNPGKYMGCPRWSEGAFNEFETNKKGWRKEVHLEHVVPRKGLVDKLLKSRSEQEIREILETGETCVILRKEHDNLLSGSGWERYRKITVVPGPPVRKAVTQKK